MNTRKVFSAITAQGIRMQIADRHVPLISVLFSLTPVKIYNKITFCANFLLALPRNVLCF